MLRSGLSNDRSAKPRREPEPSDSKQALNLASGSPDLIRGTLYGLLYGNFLGVIPECGVRRKP